MDSFEGFILAGGASSRMGTDKSKLVLDGQTFEERINGALAAITNKVIIVGKRVGSQESKLESPLPTVPDVFEAWGALGGVHAALSACGARWAVIVACDLPFISGDLLIRLASLRDNFEAVAPLQKDGRPQPLCALYRVMPCKAMAEKLIQSDGRRPVTLLQSVRTRWVAFEELKDLQGSSRFFSNVNTPDDYARAQQKGEVLQTEGQN